MMPRIKCTRYVAPRLIPAGWYRVKVVQFGTVKSGSYKADCIKIEFEIIAGQHVGRRISRAYGMDCPLPMRQLSLFLDAVGIDSTRLELIEANHVEGRTLVVQIKRRKVAITRAERALPDIITVNDVAKDGYCADDPNYWS